MSVHVYVGSADISDLFVEPVAMYKNTPREALGHLAALWNSRKGSLVLLNDNLEIMLYILKLIIRGYATWIPGTEQVTSIMRPNNTSLRLPIMQGELWRACIAASLPVLLLEMIEDELFVQQPERWIQNVLGLCADYVEVWRSYARPVDNNPNWPHLPLSLVKSYIEKLPQTWDKLWDNRDFLLPIDTEFGAINSGLLLDWTRPVFHVHQMYSQYEQNLLKLRSVVCVSWAAFTRAVNHPSDKHSLRTEYHGRPFNDALLYDGWTKKFSGLPEEEIAERWRSLVDKAVGGIGGHEFMNACGTALSSWDTMVGKELEECLDILAMSILFTTAAPHRTEADFAAPARKGFLTAQMLPSIAKALERETRAPVGSFVTPQKYPKGPNVYLHSFLLLEFTKTGLAYGRGLDSEDGLSAYKILSQCALMLGCALTAVSPMQEDMATPIITRFCKSCDQWAVACNGSLSGEDDTLLPVAQGMVAAGQKHWFIDLCQLRSMRDRLGRYTNHGRLIQAWVSFGETLGLSEKTERESHDARSKYLCSWIECPLHSEASPVELSACSGCSTERYCSRDCQINDWKKGGHRKKCRKTKA